MTEIQCIRRLESSGRLLIIDDFLSPEDWGRMWAFVQKEDYQFRNVAFLEKVLGLQAGRPLEGPYYFSGGASGKPEGRVYPTRGPIDSLFDRIVGMEEKLAGITGKRGETWDYISLRATLGPQGTSHSWHADVLSKAGAVIYYVHPQWNVQWGGELLVADTVEEEPQFARVRVMESSVERFVGYHLDNRFENHQLMIPGTGTFIMPKPNRAVFLRSGIFHTIRRVDKAAGQNVRCAVAGFFLRDDLLL
jgi:Rps23 Pro-64 3,4-dihydroxylase Tpa1-like proline 4-hydroxylase